MPHRFHRQLFRDTHTLQDLCSGGPVTEAELRQRMFVQEWRETPLLADHVLKRRQQFNFDRVSHSGASGAPHYRALVLGALRQIGDYFLHWTPGLGVAIQPGRVEEWQHFLTRMAPLAVLADYTRRQRKLPALGDRPALSRFVQAELEPQWRKSTLPTARDPVVEAVIADGGLVESHMHLNGTTEVDITWAETLLKRRAAVAELLAGHQKSEVRELYEQVEPGLTVEALGERIRIARRIRWWLWERVCESEQEPRPGLGRSGGQGCDVLDSDLLFVVPAGPNWWAIRRAQLAYDERRRLRLHPVADWSGQTFAAPHLAEGIWLTWVLRYLDGPHATERDGRLLLQYLLILNANFVPLCVQQQTQVGFDQFQKLTLNGVREEAEKAYKIRFDQLEYLEAPDVRWIEGRFAPKDSGAKLHKLLRSIVKGYEASDGYKQGTTRLALVAHFIKFDEPHSSLARCNFPHLRRKVARQLRYLLQIIAATQETVGRYICGLDCAANELHTPPEVFAPLYRQARRGGIAHFSYHVGEDFHDLASGIRAVWEAVTFLDLQAGDRLGHATAIGIDPKLWLERSPQRLVLRKQQLLDSLLFACHLLGSAGCGASLLSRAVPQVARLSREIYGDAADLDLLIAAWLLRHRDPLYLDDGSDLRLYLDLEEEREECAWRQGQAAPPGDVLDLWKRYHRPEVRRRGAQQEEVDVRALFPLEVLLQLQRAVLELVTTRMVAIEVPLTSNVRIAPYQAYREHHLWRWLGLRAAEFPDEPRPLVCLASDDPGIFATNLRNELLVIHRVLRDEFKLSEHDALRLLLTINRQAQGLYFGEREPRRPDVGRQLSSTSHASNIRASTANRGKLGLDRGAETTSAGRGPATD